MSNRAIQISKWVSLLVCVGASLMYLNGALYAVWLAGGPPTSNPQAWLHLSVIRFSISLAALLFGSALFRQLPCFPRPDKVSIFLLVLAALSLAFPHASEFLSIDSCLDLGGRWNYDAYECEK